MGGLYHFARMVKKYARVCGPVAVRMEDKEKQIKAAVLAETESWGQALGGTDNSLSREMVCRHPLEELFGEKVPLQKLRIMYENREFVLTERRDCGGFAELFFYKMRCMEGRKG